MSRYDDMPPEQLQPMIEDMDTIEGDRRRDARADREALAVAP